MKNHNGIDNLILKLLYNKLISNIVKQQEKTASLNK